MKKIFSHKTMPQKKHRKFNSRVSAEKFYAKMKDYAFIIYIEMTDHSDESCDFDYKVTYYVDQKKQDEHNLLTFQK